MSWVLPEKLTRPQLLKKFAAFYGTRRFITAFTRARHLSLSWARSTQSMPPIPLILRSILIVSSHLRLGRPSSIHPSGFPTKILYVPLLYPHTRSGISTWLFWNTAKNNKYINTYFRSSSTKQSLRNRSNYTRYIPIKFLPHRERRMFWLEKQLG